MDALTTDLELRRLRTELADNQIALENIRCERDRWRTIAEDKSSASRHAESREWWWRLNDGLGKRPTDTF